MKSILFIFGRLHFLEQTLTNFPLNEVLRELDVDIFVHGDKTYKETIVGGNSYSGTNDPAHLLSIIQNHFNRPAIICQENNKFYKRSKMQIYRWRYLVDKLTSLGYPDYTPILTIRGDTCYQFTDVSVIRNILINGTDKWSCMSKGMHGADDLMFATNLGNLRKYIEFCTAPNCRCNEYCTTVRSSPNFDNT